MKSWDINYESGLGATRVTAATKEEAIKKAEKRNKYQESFTVAESRIDYTFEKEQAIDEAAKYGCTIPKM